VLKEAADTNYVGPAPGAVVHDTDTDTSYVFYYKGYSPGSPLSSLAHEKAVFTVAIDGTPSDDLQTFAESDLGSDGFGVGLIHGGYMFMPYDYYEDFANGVFEWNMSEPLNFTKVLIPVPEEEEGRLPSCGAMVPVDLSIINSADTEDEEEEEPGSCTVLTAPGITPAIEWDDESLEQ
jgi:hypothetical protein